jgi:hypothetical protein
MYQRMDTVYVSALAALGGSAIGALASIGTSWLTQRYQNQSQRAAEKSARLEQIFGEFIDQASRVFADALTHQLEDPSTLVPLYATVGKLRLYASSKTVASADVVMSRILEASVPTLTFTRNRSGRLQTMICLARSSRLARPNWNVVGSGKRLVNASAAPNRTSL